MSDSEIGGLIAAILLFYGNFGLPALIFKLRNRRRPKKLEERPIFFGRYELSETKTGEERDCG